ncbi:hypothetical protein JWG39_13990 [Desulforhopalus vacuolatus]|uniref:hypothetical protein n=1 Tax=Desulforhopalus vacuolatus TaxID=40414 RepID=UPI00196653A3|nr:hypothetical protein [Desulforhopalus vacuolatus]MBM9520926.1 hypothetical protein [Desulforhopalus vacuolatus]
MFLVDSGNIFFQYGKKAKPQSRSAILTAEGIAEANVLMGLDAMTVSTLDLQGGNSFFLREKIAALPIVSANTLRRDGTAPFPPWILKQSGEISLAFIGISGGSLEHVKDFTLSPPMPALEKSLAELKGKAPFIVLLSTLTSKENSTIAREHPEIQVIISCILMRGNLVRLPAPGTLVAQTTSDLASLGELEISWRPDASKGWREIHPVAREELERSLTAGTEKIARMENLIAGATEKKRRRLTHRIGKQRRLNTLLKAKIDYSLESNDLVQKGEVSTFISHFHKVYPKPGMQSVFNIVNNLGKQLKELQLGTQ